MILIEIFSAPNCPRCASAAVLLHSIVQEHGDLCQWRRVDVVEEIEYAVELGVLATPSIAIDGKLVFTSIPTENALRMAIDGHVREHRCNG